VCSHDRVNLLRLATKYNIHPLYVEDVLKLEVRQMKLIVVL
jgi:Mg2+ and Co2+ transporter CorA